MMSTFNWRDQGTKHAFLGLASLTTTPLWAHGFGERYDLPVPMHWIIMAACTVVALSFFITLFISTPALNDEFLLNLEDANPAFHVNSSGSIRQRLVMGFSVFLLLLCWSTASFGIEDALMNFAPTFIWIIWWLGLSFACMAFGNLWTKCDPWLGLYLGIRFFYRLLAHQNKHSTPPAQKSTHLLWPHVLGRWPACCSLLIWCGLEIIYPIAAMPHRLGMFIAIYSIYTCAGMTLFGVKTWRAHADGFTLYFELLAQSRQMIKLSCSMVFNQKGKSIAKKGIVDSNIHPITHPSRHPDESWEQRRLSPNTDSQKRQSSGAWSTIALGIAMFTSVLFDGLHAGPAWLLFEKWAAHLPFLKHDVNGFTTGALGLLLLWMTLLGIFALTARISLLLFSWVPQYRDFSDQLAFNTLSMANSFLACLLPIAMAYLIAHNFSSLFIQGQNIIALISDPLGRGWDLFGTAHFYPDISLIDAKVTWYVATLSIVIGHILSVLMAHQIACQLSNQLHQLSFKAVLNDPTLGYDVTTIKPWILNLPMTLVMIAFTAISLSIIAEPLTNTIN